MDAIRNPETGKRITPAGDSEFTEIPSIKSEELVDSIMASIIKKRREQIELAKSQSMPDQQEIPCLEKFKDLAKAVFWEETMRTDFPFNRPLEGEEASYANRLPGWKTINQDNKTIRKSCVEFIDKFIQTTEENAIQTGTCCSPLKILDVGYGNGQALLDARRRWEDKVDLTGYGSSVLTDYTGRSRMGPNKYVLSPTRESLTQAGIKLIEGNIVDIKELIPKEKTPDVLLCCNVLQYVPYPQWDLVKDLYDAVNIGGYAFINLAHPNQGFWAIPSNHEIIIQEYQKLQSYLATNGYDNFQVTPAEGFLAFQKRETGFPFSIRSRWPTEILDQEQHLGMIRKFGLFPFITIDQNVKPASL